MTSPGYKYIYTLKDDDQITGITIFSDYLYRIVANKLYYKKKLIKHV